MGLQKVLYPWLVVGVLNESPSKLGLAQLAILLPSLLFVLPGGVVSDRRHRGTWLSLLYLLYLLPIGLLIVGFSMGSPAFYHLILYGLLFGTITAFVQPARESMLGYAAPELMHQAVAKVMVVKFIAQGVGFYLAGQLSVVSPMQLLAIQMLIFVLSAIFIRLSHPRINAMPDKSQPDTKSKESKKPLLELR